MAGFLGNNNRKVLIIFNLFVNNIRPKTEEKLITMTIISMSLPQETLSQIDNLQSELGFAGRSELIRTAVSLLVSDTKEKAKLGGNVEGVILVIHQEKYTEDLSHVPHDFSHIIKTQIHNHLKNHKCLEIFIVQGTAEKVKKFHEQFQISRKVELVKLFVS